MLLGGIVQCVIYVALHNTIEYKDRSSFSLWPTDLIRAQRGKADEQVRSP
jgi:hypothetical protein